MRNITYNTPKLKADDVERRLMDGEVFETRMARLELAR